MMDYHVEEHGAGAPLLLLHGFTGSTASWSELVPPLSQQFRLILVDLPGHGLTDTPPMVARGSMATVAADLCALLQARGASPAHVLGYSMGGRLALYMALRHQAHVASLVVESGSPGLGSAEERAARAASDESLAQRIERDGIEAFVEEWERLPLWASQRRLPEATRQRLRDGRLRNSPQGLASSLRSMGSGVQPSLWDELPSLAVPTLLITGELDQKFTEIARAMQNRCPSCRLSIIANVGHTTHLEQPAAFLATVQGFLAVKGR